MFLAISWRFRLRESLLIKSSAAVSFFVFSFGFLELSVASRLIGSNPRDQDVCLSSSPAIPGSRAASYHIIRNGFIWLCTLGCSVGVLGAGIS